MLKRDIAKENFERHPPHPHVFRPCMSPSRVIRIHFMVAPLPLPHVLVLHSGKRVVSASRFMKREGRLLTEIRVLLRFLRRQTFLVIISQKLIEEIDSFVRDVPLIV